MIGLLRVRTNRRPRERRTLVPHRSIAARLHAPASTPDRSQPGPAARAAGRARPSGTAAAAGDPRRRHQWQRQHLRLLRAMAEAAGQRVHVYTSPHLVRFNERIRIAGELVSDDRLLADAWNTSNRSMPAPPSRSSRSSPPPPSICSPQLRPICASLKSVSVAAATPPTSSTRRPHARSPRSRWTTANCWADGGHHRRGKSRHHEAPRPGRDRRAAGRGSPHPARPRRRAGCPGQTARPGLGHRRASAGFRYTDASGSIEAATPVPPRPVPAGQRRHRARRPARHRPAARSRRPDPRRMACAAAAPARTSGRCCRRTGSCGSTAATTPAPAWF